MNRWMMSIAYLSKAKIRACQTASCGKLDVFAVNVSSQKFTGCHRIVMLRPKSRNQINHVSCPFTGLPPQQRSSYADFFANQHRSMT